MNRLRLTPLSVLMTLGIFLGTGTAVRAQAPNEDVRARIEFAVSLAPSQHGPTGHNPSTCPTPAAHAACAAHKVCVPVPDIKKTPRVVYGMVEKDFCLRKCCFGANSCHRECKCPQCERVRTKRVLVKKVIVEECPSFKCVVEERCHPGCAPSFSAGVHAAAPAPSGLSTSVPVPVSVTPSAAGVRQTIPPLPSR